MIPLCDVIQTLSAQYKCRADKEVLKVGGKSETDDSKIRIIHTMADGTIRDSVEGYEVPYNDTTAIAYELLVKWIIEKQK